MQVRTRRNRSPSQRARQGVAARPASPTASLDPPATMDEMARGASPHLGAGGWAELLKLALERRALARELSRAVTARRRCGVQRTLHPLQALA
ncbi:MAG TPA: hypothetical protein VE258_09745 [Ktedonobacterales bacterium]|nr:hypothetical protein [Ktedonobacterales bacterium]